MIAAVHVRSLRETYSHLFFRASASHSKTASMPISHRSSDGSVRSRRIVQTLSAGQTSIRSAIERQDFQKSDMIQPVHGWQAFRDTLRACMRLEARSTCES